MENQENQENTGTPPEQTTEMPLEGERTFTQKELDAILSKRLAKERTVLEEKYKSEQEKAKLDEVERLKLEKQEADKALLDMMNRAKHQTLIATAKEVLTESGVKVNRLAYAVKLLDLSEVEVDDSGNVDKTAIAESVKGVIEVFPEILGESETPKPTQGNSGDGFSKKTLDTKLTRDAIAKMSKEEKTRRSAEILAFYDNLPNSEKNLINPI